MLGNKLQQLRKQRGLSQETLAERLGVSRQAVSKWETGDSSPDLDKIMQIGAIFQISIDDLLKDSVQEKEVSPKTEQPPHHKARWIGIAAVFLTAGILLGMLVSQLSAKPSYDSSQNQAWDRVQAENPVAGFSHSIAEQPPGASGPVMQFSVIPSVYAGGTEATYMMVDSMGTVSVQAAEHGDGTAFLARMEVPLYQACTISILFQNETYLFAAASQINRL